MPSALGWWSGSTAISLPLAISGAAECTGCKVIPAPATAASSNTTESLALRLPPTGTLSGNCCRVNSHRLLPKYE
ncbi:hypothetical protein Pta6605_33390 [Pseudomonas amygdali pv. tabaci]|nr:hypothetical protein Pta6605_33390 [Pseudomonas amygdali pv. tabaci]